MASGDMLSLSELKSRIDLMSLFNFKKKTVPVCINASVILECNLKSP